MWLPSISTPPWAGMFFKPTTSSRYWVDMARAIKKRTSD
jgi:hypothetical protein